MLPKEIIRKVRRIEIRTKKLVNDVFSGEYHSVFKGRGMEFEEVREYQQAGSREERAQEFGDLLFTLVNVARRQGINAETALREANRRFFRRFTYMEELCRQRGLAFSELSFEEQNALWEEAKQKVKGI